MVLFKFENQKTHVVPNLYDFISSAEPKGQYVKECFNCFSIKIKTYLNAL